MPPGGDGRGRTERRESGPRDTDPDHHPTHVSYILPVTDVSRRTLGGDRVGPLLGSCRLPVPGPTCSLRPHTVTRGRQRSLEEAGEVDGGHTVWKELESIQTTGLGRRTSRR